MFNLYYIVIDLEAGQYLLADFRILTICIFNFVHFTVDVFGFNLCIDSTTKYFQISGYMIQLSKINL